MSDHDDDQNATTPPINLPGGATAQGWWNGGTDPHGTVYPDGHVEGGISGGVTFTIPFGGSGSSSPPSSSPAPGPLDDPVSRSIERARAQQQQGADAAFPAPDAASAPDEQMGDYPTPSDFGDGATDPSQDESDGSPAGDDAYA